MWAAVVKKGLTEKKHGTQRNQKKHGTQRNQKKKYLGSVTADTPSQQTQALHPSLYRIFTIPLESLECYCALWDYTVKAPDTALHRWLCEDL